MIDEKEESTSIAPYVSVALATLGGFSIAGIPGGVVGFSAGVADEYLISNNSNKLLESYTKHSLSTTVFYSSIFFQPWATALTNYFPDYSLPINAASFALSAITSYCTDDFMSFQDKIDVPLEAFLTINKFFDEKEILSITEAKKISNAFFENPAAALNIIQEDIAEIYYNPFLYNFVLSNILSVASVVSHNFFLSILGSYSSGVFISRFLESHKNKLVGTSINSVFYDAGKLIGIFAAKISFEMCIDSMKMELFFSNHRMIIGKVSDILLDNSNARKILGFDKEEGQQIINNLFPDIYILSNGVYKLSDRIIEIFKLTISLNNIVKISPDVLMPYVGITLIPKQYFLSNLLPESKKIALKKADAQTKVGILLTDIIERAEQIDFRDGGKFMKYKYNAQQGEVNALDFNSTSINQSKNKVLNGIDLFNKIIDVVYFGLKYINGVVDLLKIPLILESVYRVSDFISSNLDSQENNIEIVLSSERVEKLFKMINAEHHQADRIPYEGQDIIFSNYSLSLDKKQIVQIDDLAFRKGKHYAITGKSGCGKSSTLIDLKSGVVGALSSIGRIYLPKEAKIMLFDQQLFIPKDSTLLESIYFPNVLDDLKEDEVLSLRAFVISLFKELEIDEFVNDPTSQIGLSANIDTQKFKLSGGQMQKIAIIQAILNKPDIIIMDENFARLDNNSVIQTQKVITKYLSEATILVVDHKAHSHNYNNFYDMEVHFADGKVVVSEIDITPIDNFNEDVVQEAGLITISDETINLIQDIGENPDMNKLEQLYIKLSGMFAQPSLGEYGE